MYDVCGTHLQVSYPLCTIASKPRLPEHCIEYVRVLLWSKEKPFNGENNYICTVGVSMDHIQSSNYAHMHSTGGKMGWGHDNIFQIRKKNCELQLPTAASCMQTAPKQDHKQETTHLK